MTLKPGMVISDEPAMYRTGEYGIRTENMILVREDSETEFGKFLGFDTLTLCFIDTSLIIIPMLSVREHAWLNKYHQMVYDKISPFLNEEEKAWLKEKTTEIKQLKMALIKSVRGFTPKIGKRHFFKQTTPRL